MWPFLLEIEIGFMCCIVAVKSVPKLRNGSSIHVSFTSMDLQKSKNKTCQSLYQECQDIQFTCIDFSHCPFRCRCINLIRIPLGIKSLDYIYSSIAMSYIYRGREISLPLLNSSTGFSHFQPLNCHNWPATNTQHTRSQSVCLNCDTESTIW